jgi:cytosine/adenosine deaminase-related metal-dependent hydrolase
MITIDAARTLGLDHEIGSLEVGKSADLITINAQQPHLTPLFMPVHRLVYQATGQDVDMVIVAGKILMRGRQVLVVNEQSVLESATNEALTLIKRAKLEPFLSPPSGFWRNTYAYIDDDRASHFHD